MTDNWEEEIYEVEIDFLGANVKMTDGALRKIVTDKIDEKIFREEKSGSLFSTIEMSEILLIESKTKRQDLVTPEAAQEAFKKGVSRFKPNLEIEVENQAFTADFGKGFKDISRIVFDVEYIVHSEKSS